MDIKRYRDLVRRRSARSPVVKNALCAFLVGGGICAAGEGIILLLSLTGLDTRASATVTTVLLILLSAALTGLGVYDKIARHAGAGTLVPVTGFANAVVSSALDTRSEGAILGVGSKIFTVAGPVLLFSTLAGTVYGILYFFLTRVIP